MVLEGFVLYLITLEDLDKDLVAAVDGPGKDAERTEMQREIAKQVGPVQEGLFPFSFRLVGTVGLMVLSVCSAEGWRASGAG